MKTRITASLFFVFLLIIFTIPVSGQEAHGSHPSDKHEEADEEFNPSEFILDHVSDSHEWHIITKNNGEHVSIYLPVILYSRESGLHFFSSKKLAHGHIYKGFRLEEEGDLKGKIVSVNENGEIDENNKPLDFSMTKTVVGMLAAALLGLVLFLTLSRSYKKTGISHPRGIQSFLEPVICFVRDDIVIPNIGPEKSAKFMPYLLSVFFFILINNVMGIIPFPPPFGANVTGNLAVTMSLALFTFFIIQFNGTKNYWRHIFATPGVPFWLLPVMVPVEMIGMISKPFALTVRLFANITAGHIIIMSLLSLIFIFDSILVSPVSILFVIFMNALELFVAFLQAYVFTLLSALFISLAVVDEHH
ncbi:MAG: F0F1 ATP synthase subunit A [Bacteroidales bacterium]|nr:F0F1 ATP synthase subunit A [Bacteroidales bacterium]